MPFGQHQDLVLTKRHMGFVNDSVNEIGRNLLLHVLPSPLPRARDPIKTQYPISRQLQKTPSSKTELAICLRDMLSDMCFDRYQVTINECPVSKMPMV